MKKNLLFLIFAVLIANFSSLRAQTCDAGKYIVGYMPSWAGTAQSIQYDKLSHVIYAFIRPTTTGGLTPIDNPQKLRDIVSLGHAQNVKVSIAVGGWSDFNNADFQSMAANPSYRSTFINNIVNLINEYNLDGVDLDWEYPREGNDPANFNTLMAELSTAMHSRGKILTAAVAASGYYADGIQSGVFASVDFLNLMAYDGGTPHSSYNYALETLNYWLGRGLPASKAVLGVPFYGRRAPDGYMGYNQLLAGGASANSDLFNGYEYNGIPTIKQKSELGKSRAAGIMIWELSQDVTGANSLLSAIYSVIKPCKGTTPNNPAAAIPGTVQAEAYSNMFGVQLETTTDANGGQNVGYIDANDWMDYAVNVSTAGTYTVGFRVASQPGGGQLQLRNSAGTSLGSITIPTTGGWQTWTTVNTTVNLPAGAQTLRIHAVTGGFNINWMQFSGPNSVNTPPTVSITSPASGTSFTAPATITITANAADANGTVSSVAFYNGSTLLGTDATSPYSYSWTGVAAGSYTITARATDNAGAVTTSSAVNVTVNGTQPGAAVPGTIQAEAYSNFFGVQLETTTDANGGQNVGYIDANDWMDYAVNVSTAGTYTVGFRVASQPGGGQLQLRNSAGTSLGGISIPATGGWQTWTTINTTVNLPAGAQTLRIHAVTGGFNINWIQFSGPNGGNTPPTVSITSPANNSTFTAPATINITANAADANGTVSSVAFYNGSTLLGTDATSPYSYSWTGVAAGSYSITARATDNAGAVTTSSAVTVTVGTSGTCSVPAWVSATAYTGGARVSRNGNVYEAKWWTQGQDPITNSCTDCPWRLIGACTSRLAAPQALSLNVYPNPVVEGNTLNIDLDSKYEEVKISIQSISGGKVHNYTFKNTESIKLDMSALPKGMNVIKVNAGHQILTKKLLFK